MRSKACAPSSIGDCPSRTRRASRSLPGFDPYSTPPAMSEIASGLYQTGEVQARSWTVGLRNASSSWVRQQSVKAVPAALAWAAQSGAKGSTPAALQTTVLQRQTGFSSTRA